MILEISSRLVRKFAAGEVADCPSCGRQPVEHKAALWKDGQETNGRLWFQCPGCGRRSAKTESHAGAAANWNALCGEKGQP